MPMDNYTAVAIAEVRTIRASESKNAHLYAIYGRGYVVVLRVVAGNRNHAARVAHREGYEVFAVNMEG